MQKINVKEKTDFLKAAIAEPIRFSLLGERVKPSNGESFCFERCFQQSNPAFLKDHQIYQTVLMPATAYLSIAFLAGITALGTQKLLLENVVVYQALPLFTSDDSKLLRTALKPAGESAYTFEISSENSDPQKAALWRLHASGTVRIRSVSMYSHLIELSNLSSFDAALDLPFPCKPIRRSPFKEERCVHQFYQEMQSRGFCYGPQFQLITRMWNRKSGVLGEVFLPDHSAPACELQPVHPVLLDACFHLLGTQLPATKAQDVYLPVGLDRMDLFEPLTPKLLVELRQMYCRDVTHSCLSADINLITPDGKLAAQLEGISFRKVSRRVLEWSLKKMRKQASSE